MPPAYVDDIQTQDKGTEKKVKSTAKKDYDSSKKEEDNVQDTRTHATDQSRALPEIENTSGEQLPPYSATQDSSFNPTEEPVSFVNSEPDFRQLPTDIPASELQASIESALQLAAQNYFQGGGFARAMNDAIQRVSTIQTTYRHSRDKGDSVTENEESKATLSQSSSTTDLAIHSSSIPRRGSQSRICHRTSATGTLFGTIWLRTTSVRADPRSNKNVDVVSSFTFFPSWWLNKVGLKYGIEANLFGTPVGWQFNINPIRAMPDDSPIFSASRKGDLSTVRFLIAEGGASVKDTNSKGWTPLHVSCYFP
jgi:Ankyrin repeats (many copies)